MYYVAIVFLIIFFIKSYTFSKLHKKSLIDAYKNSIYFSLYVLAQQLVVFAVWLLARHYMTETVLLLFIGFSFSLAHFHFFFRYRKVDGYILTIAGFIGGILFAYLYVTYFVLGLVLACIVHIGFHALLDLAFISFRWKPMKAYRK